MSNIRPICDPAIATAMLATMQSIDSSRSAPAGISEPRWRILQCIAKAAPNVPSPSELRMCSGLNKAALAEHVQALQWKGLLEMGGYRLSPTAAAMAGLRHAYSPRDVKDMKFEGIRGRSGTVYIDEFALIEPLIGDPADVPACMRPDCTPLAHPVLGEIHEEAADRPDQVASTDGSRSCVSEGHGTACADDAGAADAAADAERPKVDEHGRGSAAVARPRKGAVRCDRVATDRITEVVAGSNPAPGQPAELTPELVTSLRAAIPPRQSVQTSNDLIWPVATSGGGNSDAWEAQARVGSNELLRALRRHHPEQCGL